MQRESRCFEKCVGEAGSAQEAIPDAGSDDRQDGLRQRGWGDTQDASDSRDDGVQVKISVTGPKHRRQRRVRLEGSTEAPLLSQRDGARICSAWRTPGLLDDILGQPPVMSQ